jgi:hypothetical protein
MYKCLGLTLTAAHGFGLGRKDAVNLVESAAA